MRIAIAGDGHLGMSLMEPLLGSRHDVVALVQNGRTATGFGRTMTKAAGSLFGSFAGVAGKAIQRGIPVVWIDRMTEEELAPLRAIAPDVLLVGGFSVILKKRLLELPKIGCVNMHSSLLPKHRGPNPFSAVVMDGDEESGVTFHQMDEGIDTGPILEQYRFPIRKQDTALDVYRRACSFASLHVVGVMDRIARDGMYGRPQDGEGTYDQKLKKADSYIDWSLPAQAIERRVRGLQPFYVGRFRWRGHTITVTRVRLEDRRTEATPGTITGRGPFVEVATGDGTLTLLTAYATAPIPWIWPAPWNRVAVGEKLT